MFRSVLCYQPFIPALSVHVWTYSFQNECTIDSHFRRVNFNGESKARLLERRAKEAGVCTLPVPSDAFFIDSDCRATFRFDVFVKFCSIGIGARDLHSKWLGRWDDTGVVKDDLQG